jgi:hypothetical protein
MMRFLVLLSAASLVQAEYCALDGARAVDDLLDGATYIWASVKRCNTTAGNTQADTILCTLDISAAIESVNAMVNVILKAVQKCGHLESASAECGLAVGVLTRSFAGLSAATSGILARCPNGANGGVPKTPLVYGVPVYNAQTALASAKTVVNADKATPTSFAQCLVDIKDLTKSLFKAIKRIMTMQDSCEDGSHHCVHNTLKLVASIGAMGEYLSSAIGKCEMNATNTKLITNAECASEGLHLVRHVSNVGRAGVDMAKNCAVGEARLFELEHGIDAKSSTSPVTLTLAALLPISAVFGFVGGSRFAKSRQQADTVSCELDQ